MKKKLSARRLVSLLLITVFVCTAFAGMLSASADSIYYGIVNTNGVRIRSNPVDGTIKGLAYIGYVIREDLCEMGYDGNYWIYGPVYTNLENGVFITYGWICANYVDYHIV